MQGHRRANHIANQHRRRGGLGLPYQTSRSRSDDIDEVHQRAVAAGAGIEYGPMTAAWGVRRFYARDRFGRLVNILAHI
jgi:uncharacterized glyoxalase superfamily protein PhnB